MGNIGPRKGKYYLNNNNYVPLIYNTMLLYAICIVTYFGWTRCDKCNYIFQKKF